MLAFWTVCAILILAALIIILPSLLAKEPQEGLDSRRINHLIYTGKLGELDRDLDNDLIDREQYEIARHDLQRTLIDDMADRKEQTLKRSNKVLPAVVGLLIPAAAVLLYLQLDNGLASLSPDFQARQQGRMPSVAEAITGLEERLRQNPDNLDGWLMLGKSYLMLERFDDAVTAYIRANEITLGANPDILVAYGEAQGFAANQKFDRDLLQLFARALRINPDHEKGLWYAGLAAFQLQDYKSAAGYWERLMPQVPAEQQQVKSALQAYLDEARQKAGIETASTPPANDEPTQVGITVNVSLAERLKDRAAAADTLFVYARARHGPKMPLALVRMTAADLPATVVLNDAVAMIPGMPLSSMQQVEVIARISRSGQATMRSGDLYGSVHPVDTGNSATVSVVIDNLAD